MTTATITDAAAAIEEYQHNWSDAHKDAYGFRPRGPMPQWTLTEWEQEFHRLAIICEDNSHAEAAAEAVAAVEVEATIDRLIATGAADRAAALRWLHEAHNATGDSDYLCYQLGLPYGYFRRE
jgi:hypothetical protein